MWGAVHSAAGPCPALSAPRLGCCFSGRRCLRVAGPSLLFHLGCVAVVGKKGPPRASGLCLRELQGLPATCSSRRSASRSRPRPGTHAPSWALTEVRRRCCFHPRGGMTRPVPRLLLDPAAPLGLLMSPAFPAGSLSHSECSTPPQSPLSMDTLSCAPAQLSASTMPRVAVSLGDRRKDR